MIIRNNYDMLMSSFSMMNRNAEKDHAKRIANQVNSIYIPVGCAACGGPYPYCKTSCSLYDD